MATQSDDDKKWEQLLRLPGHKLQARLASSEFSSEELVKASLARIEKYNGRVNAILSVAPEELVLKRAAELDDERKQGHIRSRLHGIPIVIKDAIVTADELGMSTTAGAALFKTMRAKRNATVVERLLDAGLIIVGKTTMTEFCGLKSDNTPMGWCAVAGQTLSPWRRDDLEEKDQPTAAGSASGSAAAVGAGLVPLAIGTETSGSIVYPASVNGLYGLKLGHGRTPVDGLFRLSEDYDAVGPMTRDPEDAALLVNILEDKISDPVDAAEVAVKAASRTLKDFTVGVLDTEWGMHDSQKGGKWASRDVVDVYESAINTMKSSGSTVKYPVELPDPTVLKYKEQTLQKIAYSEIGGTMKDFINCFHDKPGISTLQDIIRWNEENRELALPEPYTTQTELIAVTTTHLDAETRIEAKQGLRKLAKDEGLEPLMQREGLDILLSTSECSLVTYAGLAGWPIASIPIGNWTKNSQPLGMFALARGGDQELLIDFMKAWGKVYAGVQEPDFASWS